MTLSLQLVPDYSLSQINQRLLPLLSFSLRHTDYSHHHSDTQTAPILAQTRRLLPFPLKHTDYYHSQSDTQTTPIFTQTHRLFPFLLRHTDYSQSHSHSDTQTTPISDRQPDFSILLRKSNINGSMDIKEPVHSNAVQALAGGTISALKTLKALPTKSLFDLMYEH